MRWLHENARINFYHVGLIVKEVELRLCDDVTSNTYPSSSRCCWLSILFCFFWGMYLFSERARPKNCSRIKYIRIWNNARSKFTAITLWAVTKMFLRFYSTINLGWTSQQNKSREYIVTTFEAKYIIHCSWSMVMLLCAYYLINSPPCHSHLVVCHSVSAC